MDFKFTIIILTITLPMGHSTLGARKEKTSNHSPSCAHNWCSQLCFRGVHALDAPCSACFARDRLCSQRRAGENAPALQYRSSRYGRSPGDKPLAGKSRSCRTVTRVGAHILANTADSNRFAIPFRFGPRVGRWLFTLSFQASGDQRALAKDNAMGVLARLDPDRALEMLHSMSPEEPDGAMTTRQLQLAQHLFGVLAERDGAGVLPMLEEEARLMGARGTYPYGALGVAATLQNPCDRFRFPRRRHIS